MTVYSNKRVLIVSRPESTPKASQFKLDEQQIDSDSLNDGEIMVKNLFFSIDPSLIMPMGRMGALNIDSDAKVHAKDLFKKTASIIELGHVFRGRGIGRVVHSKSDDIKVGDLIAEYLEWQEYTIVDVKSTFTLEKLDQDIFSKVSPSTELGMLGFSGSNALCGLNFVIPKENFEGKTIVVSGAAGNLGVIVVQLAKIKGLRVVGIAGGSEKCQKLLKEFNLDAVVDYKQANNDFSVFSQLLREAAPNGVDAYFDNVGGLVTDVVYEHLNENARVYFCGSISNYGEGKIIPKPEKFINHPSIASICSLECDYPYRVPEARKELFELIQKDLLKPVEWIVKGIENAPKALQDMYDGKNFGKTIVQI